MPHLPFYLSQVEHVLIQDNFERYGALKFSHFVRGCALEAGEVLTLPRSRVGRGHQTSVWFTDEQMTRLRELAAGAKVDVTRWIRGRCLAGPRRWPRVTQREQLRALEALPVDEEGRPIGVAALVERGFRSVADGAGPVGAAGVAALVERGFRSVADGAGPASDGAGAGPAGAAGPGTVVRDAGNSGRGAAGAAVPEPWVGDDQGSGARAASGREAGAGRLKAEG